MHTQKISERVSVSFVYDAMKALSYPRTVVWNGRLYPITKVGLHHTYRQGSILFHVYSVLSGELYLRLTLDSESLVWNLEELTDMTGIVSE